jgi:hypothetical protein
VLGIIRPPKINVNLMAPHSLQNAAVNRYIPAKDTFAPLYIGSKQVGSSEYHRKGLNESPFPGSQRPWNHLPGSNSNHGI